MDKTKDKKHWVWFGLNIVGFVLFVLLFVFMSMDFYGSAVARTYVDEQGEFTMQPWANTYFNLAFGVFNTVSLDPWFFVMLVFFVLFLIWSIVAFGLHLVGAKKGDKYNYLNHHVSRMTTLAFSVFLFVLTLATVWRVLILVDLNFHLDLLGGFYAVVITAMVLCIVQAAGTFMLRLRDTVSKEK